MSLASRSSANRAARRWAGWSCAPAPPPTLDATRPEGVRVAFSVFFPKGYRADLRGCSVVVRGVTCEVVGWPQRYADEHAPGELNMVAEVVAVDG